VASFYSKGKHTASGRRYNPRAMTAAHRSLPFGTKVRVVDKRSGRAVTVTINDRGPFKRGRVIDLSSAAAHALGMSHRGVTRVRVTVLDKKVR
jgi:rare lipoprotein A